MVQQCFPCLRSDFIEQVAVECAPEYLCWTPRFGERFVTAAESEAPIGCCIEGF